MTKTLPIKLPVDLALYPFQEETVNKTIEFFQTTATHSCYVASSPGLGKSITTVVTSNTLGATKNLVICPSVMRYVWRNEIYKWGRLSVSSVPTVKVVTSSNDTDGITSASWVIVSYDLSWCPPILAMLKEQRFDLLVADEAHYLSNRSKRTTTFFKELWPCATLKLLLSGTPFTTNVVNCYRPFHRILPEEPSFSNFKTFVDCYSYEQQTPWGPKYFGLKNAEALRAIIRSKFFIRFKKDEVLKDLPEVQFTKVTLDSELSVRFGGSIPEKARIIDDILHDRPTKVSESLASLRREQGEVKVPAVIDYARDLLEQELPIVVFAYHKSVVKALATALHDHAPAVITGETNAKDRLAAIEAFQGGDTNLIICNLVAGGVGITLTRANDVLLAEAAWTASENQQAISRCHRIGTKGAVTVHWFVVENSIDEDILSVVMRRTKEFSKIFDEKVDTGNQ